MVSSFKPHRAYEGNLYFILSCTCKNQHISHEDTGKGNTEAKSNREEAYRLLMSTSAFLQTRFANRRPTPLIEVRANIIFCLPSTFVFSTRKIC